jgi:hypothetical protein
MIQDRVWKNFWAGEQGRTAAEAGGTNSALHEINFEGCPGRLQDWMRRQAI